MRVLTTVLMMGASAAVAEPRQIVSGEHGDFTRLSIPIEPGSEWTIEEGKRRVVVKTVDLNLGTGRIFKRIGRGRVSDVTVGLDGVEVSLACDCESRTFTFNNNYLVLDILPNDNPANEDTRIIERGVAEPLTTNENVIALPLLTEAPRDGSLLFKISSENGSRDNPPSPREDEVLETAVTPEKVQDDPAPMTDDQNLLSTLTGQDQFSRGPDALPGIKIHGNSPGSQRRVEASEGCWPSTYIDLSQWNEDTDDFPYNRPQQSSVAIDTSLEFEKSSAVDASKSFISYGFGAEAILILKSVIENDPNISALREIASVIDGEDLETIALRSQEKCNGAGALWALILDEGSSMIDDKLRDSAILTFMRFPTGAQLAIGSRLSRALAAAGWMDQALYIREHLKRAGLSREDLRVLDAEIGSDEQRGSAGLTEIDNEIPDYPLPLLLALTAETLDENRIPSQELVNRLEEVLFTSRDLPEHPAISVAYVRILERLGRLNDAFDVLNSDDFSDFSEKDELLDLILTSAADSSSIEEFLDLVFNENAESPTPGVQNLVADRLLQLGFADKVLEMFVGTATGTDQATRRYLKAEAYAALDDPAAVEELLAGISTPRAEAIRSGASWSEIRASAPLTTDQAWRRENWSALFDAEDQILQSLAQLAVSPPTTPSPESAVSSGWAVAAEAEEVRNTLEAALQKFSVDVD